MSEENTPQPAGSALQAEIAAMSKKNAELLAEMKAEREKRMALEKAAEDRRKQQLEEEGKINELYKEAQERIKQLEQQIQDSQRVIQEKDQETQKYLAKVQFVNAAADRVVKPEQLYRLEGDHIRMNNGSLVGVYKGAEMPITQYLDAIAQDPDYQHHFRAQGGSGMGAAPSLPSSGSNPYVTRNLTEMCALEMENPELAKQLQLQAQAQQNKAAV